MIGKAIGKSYKTTGKSHVSLFLISIALSGVVIPHAMAANPLLEVRLECDSDQVYLGDSVKCRTKIYHQGQVHSVTKADADSKDVRRERYEEHKVYRDSLEGRQAVVIEFQEAVIPLKPGKLELSSLAITGTVEERKESSGSRGGGFFSFNYSFSSVEEKALPVAKTTLTVKPWPKPQPAGFSGAVGQFDVSMKTPAGTRKVNEPIAFELTISGNGSLFLQEDFDFEEVAEKYGLQSYPNKPERQTELSKEGFFATYKQNFVFIPTRPGTLNLPAVPFVFFNPETTKYEEIPIELGSFTVKADSLSGAVGQSSQTSQTIPTDPTSATSPISGAESGQEAQEGSKTPKEPATSQPALVQRPAQLTDPDQSSNWWLEHYNGVLVATGVVPLVLVGAGVLFRRRRSGNSRTKTAGKTYKLKPAALKKIQQRLTDLEQSGQTLPGQKTPQLLTQLRELRELIGELVDPDFATVSCSVAELEQWLVQYQDQDQVDAEQIRTAGQALALLKSLELAQYGINGIKGHATYQPNETGVSLP